MPAPRPAMQVSACQKPHASIIKQCQQFVDLLTTVSVLLHKACWECTHSRRSELPVLLSGKIM